MRHGIVEGEPGIFPDPISRIMRKIGGFFDRRKDDPERSSETSAEAPGSEPSAPREPDQTSDDPAADDTPSSPPEKS
jgi:hypothetical protein